MPTLARRAARARQPRASSCASTRVETRLPFLQAARAGRAVVPLLVGRLEPGEAARARRRAPAALDDAGTLLVVSSDLVHYGRRFDFLPVPPTDPAAVAAARPRGSTTRALARIVGAATPTGFAALRRRDAGATICGRHAIEVLLRALPPGDAAASALACAHLARRRRATHEQTIGYARRRLREVRR